METSTDPMIPTCRHTYFRTMPHVEACICISAGYRRGETSINLCLSRSFHDRALAPEDLNQKYACTSTKGRM